MQFVLQIFSATFCSLTLHGPLNLSRASSIESTPGLAPSDPRAFKTALQQRHAPQNSVVWQSQAICPQSWGSIQRTCAPELQKHSVDSLTIPLTCRLCQVLTLSAISFNNSEDCTRNGYEPQPTN